MWSEALCTCLCERRVMTGLRCSNDRDFTISYHNSNPIHPGLVSVLSSLLKKVLFTKLFLLSKLPRLNHTDLSQEMVMF